MILVEIRDFFMPSLFACLGVQRNQIVVRCLEKKPVADHGHTTISYMCAALGLPEIVPQHNPVASIYGPGIVWCRHIKNAVHLQNRAADSWWRSRDGDRSGCLSSNYRGCRFGSNAGKAATASRANGKLANPRKREAFDVRLIDLFQTTVATLRIVAGIRRPRVRRRLRQQRGVQALSPHC